MLRLQNVHVSYDKSKIINGVDLHIQNGEKICLLGRNGVGKTTLLKSIIGLLPVTEGSIFFNGEDITKKKTYHRSKMGMAYVPQGREIIPMLSVRDNLLMGCMEHNYANRERQLEEVLDYFPGLKEHLGRKGGVLSGGQQQQLAIGRALMSQPKVILLDEPSEGIQPNIVHEISRILNRICEEKQIAILIVEQNLEFAAKVTDQFVVMEKGAIIDRGAFEHVPLEKIKKHLVL